MSQANEPVGVVLPPFTICSFRLVAVNADNDVAHVAAIATLQSSIPPLLPNLNYEWKLSSCSCSTLPKTPTQRGCDSGTEGKGAFPLSFYVHGFCYVTLHGELTQTPTHWDVVPFFAFCSVCMVWVGLGKKYVLSYVKRFGREVVWDTGMYVNFALNLSYSLTLSPCDSSLTLRFCARYLDFLFSWVVLILFCVCIQHSTCFLSFFLLHLPEMFIVNTLIVLRTLKGRTSGEGREGRIHR